LVNKKEDGSNVTISPNSQTTQPIYGTRTSATAVESLNFNNTGIDNTYIIYLYAAKLITSPSDLNYRLTVRFPDEKVRVLAGTLSQITVTPETQASTLAIPVFRVKKETQNNIVEYTVTKI
jgi:hypothetical protein